MDVSTVTVKTPCPASPSTLAPSNQLPTIHATNTQPASAPSPADSSLPQLDAARRTRTSARSSYLNQKIVLNALGWEKPWAAMWQLRDVRDIYGTLWAWDARLRNSASPRGLWKDGQWVLKRLEDLPCDLDLDHDDEARNGWKKEYHLVSAVKHLIEDCQDSFPTFAEGRKTFTLTKVIAAINLLRKIHVTCKGRDMQDVQLSYRFPKLVIPMELQVVTRGTANQWCDAWMEGNEERGVKTGVYQKGIGLIQCRDSLAGSVEGRWGVAVIEDVDSAYDGDESSGRSQKRRKSGRYAGKEIKVGEDWDGVSSTELDSGVAI